MEYPDRDHRALTNSHRTPTLHQSHSHLRTKRPRHTIKAITCLHVHQRRAKPDRREPPHTHLVRSGGPQRLASSVAPPVESDQNPKSKMPVVHARPHQF